MRTSTVVDTSTLTDKQVEVFTLLFNQTTPVSPTEVGLYSGKSYSSANSALKKLASLGLANKELGRYTITPFGRRVFSTLNPKGVS